MHPEAKIQNRLLGDPSLAEPFTGGGGRSLSYYPEKLF
jgi:hypothetical protein